MGAPPRRPGAAALALHLPEFEAYEAYHRGRVHAEQRTREELLTAIEYFKEAVRRDPAYAQPWAGMADSYLALGIPTFGGLHPQEARRLANEAALKALELQPELAEAQNSLAFLAYVYDWNWQSADERFRRAIALDPQFAGAHHWYGDFLIAMGRYEEAGREIEKAAELEPLSILIRRDRAWHFFCQRRYDEAERQLRETLAVNPRYTPARSLLGRVLTEQGRHQEALTELETVAVDIPGASALGFLAYANAAAGRRQEAEALLEKLVSSSGREYVSPYYVALVLTRLGRDGEALGWLERGFVEQDTTMVSLKVDPRFDTLRTDARFRDLLRRMRFPGV
jgi:tetratricopeptide (TPR) repeat protein